MSLWTPDRLLVDGQAIARNTSWPPDGEEPFDVSAWHGMLCEVHADNWLQSAQLVLEYVDAAGRPMPEWYGMHDTPAASATNQGVRLRLGPVPGGGSSTLGRMVFALRHRGPFLRFRYGFGGGAAASVVVTAMHTNRELSHDGPYTPRATSIMPMAAAPLFIGASGNLTLPLGHYLGPIEIDIGSDASGTFAPYLNTFDGTFNDTAPLAPEGVQNFTAHAVREVTLADGYHSITVFNGATARTLAARLHGLMR